MSAPFVSVHLDRSRDGRYWRWVVHKCCLCGGSHIHGGGKVTGDPKTLLGHRAAHCPDASLAGYELVDGATAETARLLAEVR